MIIILGLVVLVAAVVIGVAGVLVNHGSDHALVHPFAVFGYHVTGSTGTLFLYGIVLGAIGVLGLGLLLAWAPRTSPRGRAGRRGGEARPRRAPAARRGPTQPRPDTASASQARDALIDERETARAHAASQPGDSTNQA